LESVIEDFCASAAFFGLQLGKCLFFFIDLRVRTWSRVHLEKWRVAQLVEKCSVFRGMQRFMAMFQKTPALNPVPI